MLDRSGIPRSVSGLPATSVGCVTVALMTTLMAWPAAWAADEEVTPPFAEMMFTPTRVYGDVGFSYSQHVAEEKKPDAQYYSMINMTIGKGAIGYFWDPNIIQWNVNVNVGITLNQRVEFSSSQGQPSDSSSTFRILNGNANIFILPRSPFPLKLYQQQSLGDTTESDWWNRAMATRRRGFVQRYQNEGKDFQGELGYDQSLSVGGPEKLVWGVGSLLMPLLREVDTSFRTDTLTLNTHHELDDQRIDLSGREVWQSNGTYGMQERFRESALLARHDFTGLSNWSLGSMANVIHQRELILKRPDRVSGLFTATSSANTGADMQQQLSLRESLWHQWISNGYWRAEEEPLQISGSVRYFRTRDNLVNATKPATSGGWVFPADLNASHTDATTGVIGTTSHTETISAVTGASYLINPQLQLNANVNSDQMFRQQGSSRDTQLRSGQTTDLTYTSENIELLGGQYHWLTALMGGNQMADGQKPSPRSGQRVGHGIFRNDPIDDNLILSTMVNENFAATESAAHLPLYSVFHTATLRMTQEGEQTRTYLDLTGMDNRLYGDLLENYQLVTLQLSRNWETSTGATWGGNMTVQWDRQDRSSETTGAKKNVFTYLNLNYNHPNLFGVRRLRLSSMLLMGSNDWRFGVYNPMQLRRSWWSRLDYQIGKLTVGLTTSLNDVSMLDEEGKTEGLVLFEIRRAIGIVF